MGLTGTKFAVAAVGTSAVTEFAGFPVATVATVATVAATAGSAREPAGNLLAIGFAILVAMQTVV